MLCACPYFAVELLELDGVPATAPGVGDARTALATAGITAAIDLRRTRPSMRGIVVLEGEAFVSAGGRVVAAGKGRSIVVPASLTDAALGTKSRARVVLVYEPDLAADVVAPLRGHGYTHEQIAQLGDLA